MTSGTYRILAPGVGMPPVDELHRLIGRCLTVNGVEPPRELLNALERQHLLPWATYTEMLFELDIPLADRRRIKSAWTTADAQAGNRRRAADILRAVAEPENRLRALAPTQDSELRADSEEEFVALLRLIQARSGHTVVEIGKRAELPRSQTYSMLRRGTLPSKGPQVEALVKACGLPTEQIQQVMRLWSDLRDRKTTDRHAGPGKKSPAETFIESCSLHEAQEFDARKLWTEVCDRISSTTTVEACPDATRRIWVVHNKQDELPLPSSRVSGEAGDWADRARGFWAGRAPSSPLTCSQSRAFVVIIPHGMSVSSGATDRPTLPNQPCDTDRSPWQ